VGSEYSIAMRKFSFEDIDGKKPEIQQPAWAAWDEISKRTVCARCGACEPVDEPDDFYRCHTECLSPSALPMKAGAALPAQPPAIVEQDTRDKIVFSRGSSCCQMAMYGVNDGLLPPGRRGTIQFLSSGRMMVLEPFDLLFPGGEGSHVSVRWGDVIQYEGPYDALKIYKGSLFRQRKANLYPGVPITIEVNNEALGGAIDLNGISLVCVVLVRDRY
jgi:hypothetical protein